jgi:hypothetical protein
MVTDAAVYMPDGTLTANNVTKATALVTLPAVISCTGPDVMQRSLTDSIERKFETFDDFIATGEQWLDQTFREAAEQQLNGDAGVTMYVIGWHRRRNSPGAYAINLWTDEASQRDQWIANSKAAGADIPETGKFDDMSQNIGGSPLPGREALAHARFEIRDPDQYDEQLDLMHLIEIARHSAVRRVIGGKAVLSSIDESGVTQRVLHHWQKDAVGERIEPRPILDWRAWRASKAIASAGIPDGLSRLQRERLEKKARKGTLR